MAGCYILTTSNDLGWPFLGLHPSWLKAKSQQANSSSDTTIYHTIVGGDYIALRSSFRWLVYLSSFIFLVFAGSSRCFLYIAIQIIVASEIASQHEICGVNCDLFPDFSYPPPGTLFTSCSPKSFGVEKEKEGKGTIWHPLYMRARNSWDSLRLSTGMSKVWQPGQALQLLLTFSHSTSRTQWLLDKK